MAQDRILNRIQRVHPLPLRAQALLQQTQVLHRNSHLAGTGVEKLQLFLGVRAWVRLAEGERAQRGLLPMHGNEHQVVQPFVLQICLYRRHHFAGWNHSGLRIRHGLLHRLVEVDQGGALEKFRRNSDVVRNIYVLAVERAEPGRLSSKQLLQLFQRSLHHRTRLLRLSDGRG